MSAPLSRHGLFALSQKSPLFEPTKRGSPRNSSSQTESGCLASLESKELKTLALEPGPQLDELCLPLRPDRTSEVEKDFESGSPRLVEELKAASSGAIHVARLLHGEHS